MGKAYLPIATLSPVLENHLRRQIDLLCESAREGSEETPRLRAELIDWVKRVFESWNVDFRPEREQRYRNR